MERPQARSPRIARKPNLDRQTRGLRPPPSPNKARRLHEERLDGISRNRLFTVFQLSCTRVTIGSHPEFTGRILRGRATTRCRSTWHPPAWWLSPRGRTHSASRSRATGWTAARPARCGTETSTWCSCHNRGSERQVVSVKLLETDGPLGGAAPILQFVVCR